MTFYDRLESVSSQIRHIAHTGEFVRLKGLMGSIQWLLVEAGRTGVPASELEPVIVATARLRAFVLDLFDQGNLDEVLPAQVPGVTDLRVDLVTLWSTLPLAAAAHLAGRPEIFRSLVDRSMTDHRRRGPGAAVERAARGALEGEWDDVAAAVRGIEADPDLEGEDFETVTLCRGLLAVAEGNLSAAEGAMGAFARSPAPEAVSHAALLHAIASLRGLDLPRPVGLLPP